LVSKQLLSERELHSEYGLSVPWLRKKRRLGGGPAHLKLGRLVRYRRVDIDAYIAAHVVEDRGSKESQ
jgi:predicted DNA-binding transcriptional regulator AlpA